MVIQSPLDTSSQYIQQSLMNPQGAQGAALSLKRDNMRMAPHISSGSGQGVQNNHHNQGMIAPQENNFFRNSGTGSININTSQIQNTGITQHYQLQKSNQREVLGGRNGLIS